MPHVTILGPFFVHEIQTHKKRDEEYLSLPSHETSPRIQMTVDDPRISCKNTSIHMQIEHQNFRDEEILKLFFYQRAQRWSMAGNLSPFRRIKNF